RPPPWYFPWARRCSRISPRGFTAKTEKARCSAPSRCASILPAAPIGWSAASTRMTCSSFSFIFAVAGLLRQNRSEPCVPSGRHEGAPHDRLALRVLFGYLRRMQYLPIHGRGASFNPPNRFERLSYEPDPEWEDPDEPDPWRTTQYF